jgi:hypothetical protein
MTLLNLRKEIFLIPFWVKTILNRNNLPIKTALDVKLLATVLTSEDLACISVMNEQNKDYFGVSNYSCIWSDNSESYAFYMDKVRPFESLVTSVLENRLLNESAIDVNYPEAFEIQDIDSNSLLVSINPGYFGGANKQLFQTNLVRQLLTSLYAYQGYDDMTRNQIFEQYLNTL